MSHPLDLTPARLGIQNPSQPRRDWDTNRPGRFFLPGEEDVTERVGYEKVGRRARAKMEDEVSGSKGLTKRGLLRRMEKMAGGGEKLVEGLSRAVEGAKKIESLKELEQMKKEGFTLGKEFVRLAVSECVRVSFNPPPTQLTSSPTVPWSRSCRHRLHHHPPTLHQPSPSQPSSRLPRSLCPFPKLTFLPSDSSSPTT